MLFFRAVETGKKYELKGDDRYLNNCPECGTELESNRYKDLYVTNNIATMDTSIDLAMVYCSKCLELYIRNDF
jgi:hypothetical protein